MVKLILKLRDPPSWSMNLIEVYLLPLATESPSKIRASERFLVILSLGFL